MNPNWLGIACALLALPAFRLSFGFASKLAFRRRLAFAGIGCLLAIPGLSFTGHYFHLVPEWALYFQFRSIPGTELALIPIGALGGFAAAVLPRVLLILPLMGAAVFVTVPFIKPFIGPIPKGALKDQWRDGVCLQSTYSTCGAASLATILKTQGADATESELAAEAHSYSGGTEAWYLARCARSRGMAVRFVSSEGFDLDAPLPAMFGVRLGSNGHFIPILERRGDLFLVGDPLHGAEWLTLESMNRRYRFTGFRMEVSRKGK